MRERVQFYQLRNEIDNFMLLEVIFKYFSLFINGPSFIKVTKDIVYLNNTITLNLDIEI